MELTPIPFYFVRHGQTDWNVQKLCQGSTDTPLNDTGIEQAGEARALLADLKFSTVCCSSLSRARQTAEIITQTLACPLVEMDALQECHFGELEGKPMTGQALDLLIREGQQRGGESLEQFQERVVSGINKALEQPGPVLIVSHGAVFRVLSLFLGLPQEESLPNCMPVKFIPPEGPVDRWKVISI